MGVAPSTCRNNDELVDYLREGGLIKDVNVEHCLRLVDRGFFFPPTERYLAYRDQAWIDDEGSPSRLHISAPSIYANVLDNLDLQRGQSFLNIGSGSGYLSTVVGFLIGSSGSNHGVEICEDIVQYARERVDEFSRTAEVQCYEWSKPVFKCGNGLMLGIDYCRRYDRIYCGATVPPNGRRAILRLLKIGGIIVMPFYDQLERIRRLDATEYEIKLLTSVSFAVLITPSDEELDEPRWSSLPEFQVKTLQHLAAEAVRRSIRLSMSPNYPIRMRRYEPLARSRMLRTGVFERARTLHITVEPDDALNGLDELPDDRDLLRQILRRNSVEGRAVGEEEGGQDNNRDANVHDDHRFGGGIVPFLFVDINAAFRVEGQMNPHIIHIDYDNRNNGYDSDNSGDDDGNDSYGDDDDSGNNYHGNGNSGDGNGDEGEQQWQSVSIQQRSGRSNDTGFGDNDENNDNSNNNSCNSNSSSSSGNGERNVEDEWNEEIDGQEQGTSSGMRKRTRNETLCDSNEAKRHMNNDGDDADEAMQQEGRANLSTDTTTTSTTSSCSSNNATDDGIINGNGNEDNNANGQGMEMELSNNNDEAQEEHGDNTNNNHEETEEGHDHCTTTTTNGNNRNNTDSNTSTNTAAAASSHDDEEDEDTPVGRLAKVVRLLKQQDKELRFLKQQGVIRGQGIRSRTISTTSSSSSSSSSSNAADDDDDDGIINSNDNEENNANGGAMGIELSNNNNDDDDDEAQEDDHHYESNNSEVEAEEDEDGDNNTSNNNEEEDHDHGTTATTTTSGNNSNNTDSNTSTNIAAAASNDDEETLSDSNTDHYEERHQCNNPTPPTSAHIDMDPREAALVQQRNDIQCFAREFERRIYLLPLNKTLMDFIKNLS